MKKTTSLVGQYFAIPAGATVYRQGKRTTQLRDTTVRVLRSGKNIIYWKSHGYMAHAAI